MARNKRNSAERERDLEKLAVLYCKGWSQLRMAAAFNVTRKQIYYDIKVLHQRWQDSALSHFEERKARELAKIDHLEAVAWEAWERSCLDAESSSSSLVRGRVNREGAPLPDLERAEKTVKGQAGDERFLERVAWCINKRCEILGLNAPAKFARTNPDGSEPEEALSEEERLSGFHNLMALLGQRNIDFPGQGNGHAARPALIRPGEDPGNGQHDSGPLAGEGPTQPG